jgi:translocation and assembly module TamB
VAAFGAELVANVSLEDSAHYRLNGNLRNLDLRTAARGMRQKDLAYDGTVSGSIAAEGDLKTPGTKGLVAHARLSISPGRRGIPVSGRLYADYNGETENINVADSFIALPHTRVSLTGSLGNRLNIVFTTRDLNDLLAAAPPIGPLPVMLNGGQASVAAVVTGRLTSPNITSHLAVNRFIVEGRQFDALALDIAGSSSRAAISNASLNHGPMQARFAAAVGLKNWKPTPNQPISVEASLRNGDLADVMAMAGQATTGYSGVFGADANVSGTIANPRGTANLRIAGGTIQDECFDNILLQINMADQLVTIPTAYISAGVARVSLTAEFRHPPDSFTTGQLHAHVQSSQVDFARLRAVQKQQPNTAGLLQIDVDVTGNLSETHSSGKEQNEFLPTSVKADASARGLRFEGQNYGNLNATARTKGQTVNYNVSSDFAGSHIRVSGDARLERGYPTNADVNISHLPIERMLVLTDRQDIPAKGTLSGTAHFGGSMENPECNMDLDLESAALYDEPIDHLRARVTYLAKTIDVPQFEIVSGPSRLELMARYDHQPGNLQAGNIQFRVNSSRLDLTRIRNLQKMRSGMGGILQLTASGAATVRGAEPHLVFRDLNAHLAATGIAAQGKNFGDLTLTAETTGGRLNFALDSNLASSSIQGRGTAQLSGDYPVTAQLTFDNVAWTRIQTLLGPGGSETPNFDALAGGQITMTGPAMRTGDMRASLQLTRVQLTTTPQPGSSAKAVVIQNQEPITATLDHGIARLENLHLTGPQTDLRAVGMVSLQAQTVEATVNANANLGVLQQFSRDVVSSGEIVLSTTVRGRMAKPVVNGRLELRHASLNYAEISNGITNANGVVLFNGNNASIQSLSAELGGGKLTVGGFLAYNELMRFRLSANAAKVRIRLQQGVSAVADANIQLTGGTKASVVSGTVTIDQVTYAPTSDFGSILSRSAPLVQSPTAPSPLLDNMKLDIQVRTSSSLAVQALLAQNLQADANLRIRGTASQPGVLGRVSITEGQLVFFSSTYSVNSGTISFYNPIRIEPVLNISLETQAKGVDVLLKVTGPIDNMKLSYTSDPALQFQEIVSLLASGKTPTSDPTILANQPSQPPQSLEQMGESALMSKALVDPMASRLQRVFGVSQLKIDPTLTTGSDLPQARLTLQQQVASNITFTYVTALNDPNSQTVRVEWAVNPQWSAMASRDQNGIVSIKVLYKKQFR